MVLSCPTVSKAPSAEFREAVACALLYVGRQDLTQAKRSSSPPLVNYDGRDVFAWLSTGYGKSLCHQLLPFMFDFKLKQTSSRRTGNKGGQ